MGTMSKKINKVTKYKPAIDSNLETIRGDVAYKDVEILAKSIFFGSVKKPLSISFNTEKAE
jgi:hypothetical protein